MCGRDWIVVPSLVAVLEPKLVEKFGDEILRNNNIPSTRSEDLKDVWP